MEQEENKVQDPAAAEETARKREEAIRKVEAMLSQNRPNIDQGEINLNSRQSWAAALKRVNMPAPRDYGYELLESYKPEKPLQEMDSDEAEAERKKAEAIARVAAMMQQQQADDERRYHNIDGKRARNRIQLRRPKESENSVDIHGFLSQYKLSPEAQERFEKIRFGVGKGTVRPHLGTRLGCIVAPPMLLFTAWVLGQFPSMETMKPVFIILAVLMLLAAYYVSTWKLEYDSESGLVRYHSLFHGTNLYELKELMGFMVTSKPEKPFPLSLLGVLDPRQYLVIRLPDHTLNIPLLFSRTVILQTVELEGYEGSGDFCRCLEQYQRELYRKQSQPEEKPTEPVPAPEKPAAPEQPEPAAPEKPAPEKPVKPAEQPKPVPKPDPVDLAKAREMFAQPAASALSMPERGSDFPDPTRSSAFPDPAQKPKPDVDVDALFNQVLREHGRLK